MPLGHGSIAEFAVASVRGGGVQNVGSPFISGSSFAASVGDESVTGSASISQSGSSLVSTFSIGTETVTPLHALRAARFIQKACVITKLGRDIRIVMHYPVSMNY